ncbi:AAA family ATPase [Nautilia sp.]
MIERIIREITKVIKGKDEKIKIILAAFLSGQHVLIEDIPGVGKTTMAKTIANVLGLEFKRIQFTADMLPSDIIGVNYFDLNKKEFVFKKGAVFTDILLADEINRASPKAQSALLEAMEERQVSIDGVTYPLSGDFFVIATQNPAEYGIFPLPLSQIDRFGISLSIGYANPEAEKMILKKEKPRLKSFKESVALKEKVKNIYVDEKIYDLIIKIGSVSRNGMFETGLSTRALISLLELSKAYAFLEKREYVIDRDVFDILGYVANHRLKDKNAAEKIIQAYY